MTASPCPTCGWHDGEPLVLRDRMHELPGSFPARRCTRCGSVHLDPVPDRATLARHYPEEYAPWAAPAPASSPNGGRAALRSLLLRRGVLGRTAAAALARLTGIETFALSRHFAEPGRVLDIGCGSGAVLDSFKRLGWSTAGVEPGDRAAARAREAGHAVVTGGFPETLPPGPFELVVFVHSLEHLASPVGALSTAARLLSPGGLIFVATPNAGGRLARRAGADWWQLDAPRHLVVLSRAGLEAAARPAGLRVARHHTHSLPMGSLVTRRLRTDPSFRLESWPGLHYGIAARTAARSLGLALDAAGVGDNLHATFELGEGP